MYRSFDKNRISLLRCYINVLKIVRRNIHFNISGQLVITEFDITGVDSIANIRINAIVVSNKSDKFMINKAQNQYNRQLSYIE